MLPAVKVDYSFARLDEALVLATGVVFLRVTQRTLPGVREFVHFAALLVSKHILAVASDFVFVVRTTQQLFLQVLGLDFLYILKGLPRVVDCLSALGNAQCSVFLI